MNWNNLEEEDCFDEDPASNLRIENEISKLKLRAEFGATINSYAELPPEVEKEFLEMIREVETNELVAPMISVYNFIGSPSYIPAASLSDHSIAVELERLFHLLGEHDLSLVVLKEYHPRIIYRFITEELFNEEIRDVRIPGLVGVFCYEEFHSHPEIEIEMQTAYFMDGWQQQKWNNPECMLADYAVIPDGRILEYKRFRDKLLNQVGKYKAVLSLKFEVSDISYEWKDGDFGLGYAEGHIRYEAIKEDGNSELLEDDFKIYFSNTGDHWKITFFFLPGFDWD